MVSIANQRATSWLEEANLRPTRQRLCLAEVLVGDGQDKHVTAETLFAKVQQTGYTVSLATVYNTLKTFCDAGLIQEIIVDGSKSYFDTKTYDHPHFYWEDEAKLTDAPLEDLEIKKLPAAPDGTKVTSVNVVIRLKNELN